MDIMRARWAEFCPLVGLPCTVNTIPINGWKPDLLVGSMNMACRIEAIDFGFSAEQLANDVLPFSRRMLLTAVACSDFLLLGWRPFEVNGDTVLGLRCGDPSRPVLLEQLAGRPAPWTEVGPLVARSNRTVLMRNSRLPA